MMRKLVSLVLFAAACAASAPAVADPITFSAYSRGSYNSSGSFATGGSGTATGNTLTGLNGLEARSFFAFDLSSLSGVVTSASMSFDLHNGGSGGPTETIGLYDFLGSISALTGNTGGVAAFSDLGSGQLFGTGTASTSQTSGTLTITLDAAAIAAIIAAEGGKFAVGGALTSISGSSAQFLFGASINDFATTLTLDVSPVPEPASLTIFGAGLLAMAALRRRRAAR